MDNSIEGDERRMARDLPIHMIGNAHLDPVWLWQWQEGYAEIKATFRSALDRLRDFPDFIFTCAGAAYYKWVEDNAPDMFEEIKERIREGRWVVVGGWWIQPDCNLPSGESFVRHGLYSQRYFQEKFGVTAKVGYNVDSFGHHGMLPQILKKSGMDAYVFMRPDHREKSMEHSLFWWESIDGSRVMTFRIPFSYGNWSTSSGHQDPFKGKVLDVMALAERQGHGFMNFYGVGNHGGGPTIANLQAVHRLQEEYGIDVVKLSSPNAYFAEMADTAPDIPVHQDDLQHHASGCYSTHSETKALNRKAEHRLLTAEKFSAMAHQLLGLSYPDRELRRGWENVMFNHFHDIMGGCSIKEAYQDARESYGESLHLAAVSLNAALQKMSWSIDTMKDGIQALSKDMDWGLWEQKDQGIPVVVFNPLSWEVVAPIQINKKIQGITDEQGQAVDYQVVRGSRTNRLDKHDTLFMGRIPAMGYRVYWIYKEKAHTPEPVERQLSLTGNVIENDWYRLEVEPHTGYIQSLFDKQNGIDVFDGRGAVPVVIDEHHCDTWAHGVFEFRDEIARFGDAELRVVESGPLRAKLRVTSRYNRSVLQQDFVLYRDKPGIEVKVKLDWREQHKMLKLSFPVRVTDPKAVYEIPYGHIERPVNGEEEPGQQWTDVTGTLADASLGSYGLTLLNDAKYSFDVKDNDLRMTVVRGAIYADHYGERDEDCEFMDQGIQEFQYALLPHAGDWREADAVRKAMELNVPPAFVIETYHKGTLPQRFEGIHISASRVLATVFKMSEDGLGYVLRCYETAGREGEAVIEVPVLGRTWKAAFDKYEIKTFYIPKAAEAEVKEVNLIELDGSQL